MPRPPAAAAHHSPLPSKGHCRRARKTAPMKIVSWNVNSVKARLSNVITWLETAQPDALLLQEIKCETASFPVEPFKALGYDALIAGQKAYNGVALLSRLPMRDPLLRLPGEETDEQARYLEASIGDVRVGCLYLPNGNPVGSEKYPYKLRWMDRLRQRAACLLASRQPVALGGDYNVIPHPCDVYDPEGWREDALFRQETRLKFQELLGMGFRDAFRDLHPDQAQAYSFWDYQAGAWPKNHGIRIDHFLLSPQAADRLLACTIDKEPRGREKASDHVPIILDLLDQPHNG
jgi:exodeoxyribonuclease III